MYQYIHSAYIQREGKPIKVYLLINSDRIEKVSFFPLSFLPEGCEVIDASGLLLLPGIIDTHVHFREPGAEAKATMKTESLAALAGGVTTVFDMPNNTPQITTLEALKQKISIAKKDMRCNYKFFFGITNDNVDEALTIPKDLICGYKLFLGSSTGNMLVTKQQAIEKLFANATLPVSCHCEDEDIIRSNIEKYKKLYSETTPAPASIHPLVRNSEACAKSTRFAIDVAKKYSTHLNIAHLSTKEEVQMLSEVNHDYITAEVTPNHLYFTVEDYEKYGNKLKCNPAIKTKEDQESLRSGLKNGTIDIVASDHAPHLLAEKDKPYFSAPSGIPSIQHTLLMMLDLVSKGVFTIDEVEEKMCHAPARVFGLKDRGDIKEGYYADLVLVNMQKPYTVTKDNILYKCGWSLLEEKTLPATIVATFVNGKRYSFIDK